MVEVGVWPTSVKAAAALLYSSRAIASSRSPHLVKGLGLGLPHLVGARATG